MVLTTWLRKAKAKVTRSRRKDSYLLNVHDFRLAAARERVRADRNCLPLTILAIELPADHATQSDFVKLSYLLRRRLRVTDIGGYLADGRVAVLLPDTAKAGAWKVASDICDFYPLGEQRPNCEVYVYPDEDSATRNDSPDSVEELTASGSSGELDSLFAHPTPPLKRTIDVIVASVGLLVIAPFLLLMAAVIKLTSPGPVLFTQWREGHGGRRFRMYKLRSMRAGAHRQQATLRAFSVQDGPAFKMPQDPRTTWIGRVLRRTSLDELPQLWNVLMGDMSLVGPRPLPVEESKQCAPWQRRRLAVLPGLTCVWQIRGRSTVSFDDWMRMDLEYLRDRSLSYDMRLMVFTIPSLLLSRGPR
jgi:lipopolysaccharide/colanic/teichoic acid biosynthesis glycosyltransferase